MQAVIAQAEQSTAHNLNGQILPLYGMIRYHLGWADERFQTASFDAGKRIRPFICLQACAAVCGDPEPAVDIAAAIEILHNFTLVHDDIQDRSETRRHRPTVWSLWGESQAINAGDAMFALGQLAALRILDGAFPAERSAPVLRGYNEVALRIVEGQVLDLGFEERWTITARDYLEMIRGKSAAIVAYAAWAGAILGGAGFTLAERFRMFGETLGLGFQIRDDVLGIWGETAVTGKRKGDDIRRRKKSLPIIKLASVATSAEADRLREIYSHTEVGEADLEWIMALFRRYEIEDELQSDVDEYHRRARQIIENAVPDNTSRRALLDLLQRLSTRSF